MQDEQGCKVQLTIFTTSLLHVEGNRRHTSICNYSLARDSAEQFSRGVPEKKRKMATRNVSVLGLFLFVCAASMDPGLAINGSHCTSLGYTSNLMCSSCRELKEFNLQPLEDECDECCQSDGNEDEKVFI